MYRHNWCNNNNIVDDWATMTNKRSPRNHTTMTDTHTHTHTHTHIHTHKQTCLLCFTRANLEIRTQLFVIIGILTSYPWGTISCHTSLHWYSQMMLHTGCFYFCPAKVYKRSCVLWLCCLSVPFDFHQKSDCDLTAWEYSNAAKRLCLRKSDT